MAYIDYNFVWSGRYAKLKDPTKIVLHVIAAICKRHTGEFRHSIPTIAEKAGISVRAVQYALRELESHDPPIISSELRPGRPAMRTHLPTANFNQQDQTATESHRPGAPHAPGGAPHAPVPVHHMHHLPDENSPQTREISASTDPPFPPNNNSSSNNSTLTTTAADRISKSLIQKMISEYGAEIVNQVVVAMRGFNGEIKDANAYFRSCVMNRWIPTSKKARKRWEIQDRIQELEAELEAIRAADVSQFEDLSHFGVPRTPEEVKADLVNQYEEHITRLREVTL